MDEFLKAELSDLPFGVRNAILKQLESAIRASRAAIYYDKPDDINLRCITICSRLASTIEFAATLKQNINNNK